MKEKVTLFLFFINAICYSQILFEKGYFIDNSNQKIECLIKNIDWNKNPKEFDYKEVSKEEIQKRSIDNVKEFVIYGKSKYVRELVLIDRSGNRINDINSNRNPVFKEETLFLKVLVEGDAILYEYIDTNLSRYFYRTKGSEISQLVYKKYIIDNMMGVNNNFRQQILNAFQSEGITLDDVSSLGYDRKSLEKFFVKMNKNMNAEYVQNISKEKRDLFNLTVRAGVNFNDFSVVNKLEPYRSADFGEKTGVRFGVEAEVFFPFNNNKWSLIIEPTFSSYKAEKKTDEIYHSVGYYASKVNYQSLELPVGIRYYFYLNNQSKIFINSSLVFELGRSSSLEYRGNNDVLLNEVRINPATNLALGVGYKFQDKYGIELRYNTDKSLVNEGAYDAIYKSVSIIFGYTIF
jgi:uncharacterized protein YifE (UPF0438 family)